MKTSWHYYYYVIVALGMPFIIKMLWSLQVCSKYYFLIDICLHQNKPKMLQK